MKRWIVTGGLVAWALAAILLVTFAFTRTDPVTTEDIDAIMDPSEKRLDEASFIPGVSKDEVVERALAPIHRKDECRSVLKGQGSAPVLLG